MHADPVDAAVAADAGRAGLHADRIQRRPLYRPGSSAPGRAAGGCDSAPERRAVTVPGLARSDYAFPFRISPASGQAAQSDYATHVEDVVRQALLTAPGGRANQPEFGCGLRRLLFAPASGGTQGVQSGVACVDAASASS